MFYSEKLNKFSNIKHCFFSKNDGFSKMSMGKNRRSRIFWVGKNRVFPLGPEALARRELHGVGSDRLRLKDWMDSQQF